MVIFLIKRRFFWGKSIEQIGNVWKNCLWFNTIFGFLSPKIPPLCFRKNIYPCSSGLLSSPDLVSVCLELYPAGGGLLLHRLEGGHCRHDDICRNERYLAFFRTFQYHNLSQVSGIATRDTSGVSPKYLLFRIKIDIFLGGKIFRQRTSVKWLPLQREEIIS